MLSLHICGTDFSAFVGNNLLILRGADAFGDYSRGVNMETVIISVCVHSNFLLPTSQLMNFAAHVPTSSRGVKAANLDIQDEAIVPSQVASTTSRRYVSTFRVGRVFWRRACRTFAATKQVSYQGLGGDFDFGIGLFLREGVPRFFGLAFHVKVASSRQKIKHHVTENEHLGDFIEFFRHEFPYKEGAFPF
ncbi:hypothetical protein ARMGADRAFT_620471 [Armillaria gallica]|uniref:Uncharacterized protein n=1 Tax=Armillaria gallica TaxID=47427 RepID=A0A2H3CZD5_ARMGA|nr:hypothetical protein ARMGADRAFT_620471 [Armillaria gallica]